MAGASAQRGERDVMPCHNCLARVPSRPARVSSRPVPGGLSSSYQFPLGTDKKAALEGGPSYQQIKCRITGNGAYPNRPAGARGPLRAARGSLPMGPAGFGVVVHGSKAAGARP